MPVGMQIVTPPFSDMKTFQIAHAYERAAEPLFVGNRVPDFRNGLRRDLFSGS